LSQLDLELRFHRFQVRAGLDAADQVKPVEFGAVQNVEAAAQDERRVAEWNPESGRIRGEAFAEEAGRRDAGDGEGLAVDQEGSADHRRVLAEFLPPSAIADDRDRGRALLIIRRLEQTARPRAEAEGVKGVAGDEFRAEGLRRTFAAGAPDPDLRATGLKSGEGEESRSMVAELTILLGRKQRP